MTNTPVVNQRVLEIAILIYPEAEVLDYAGPFEVFSTANRILQKLQLDLTFHIQIVSENNAPVRTRGGLLVTPHASISQVTKADIIIVVGGVHTQAQQSIPIIRWIQEQHNTCMITASVCTGAFLLAQAGLLENKMATTHWEDLADLRAEFPNVHVVGDKRWVDQGDIVTSAGITAGIDMSLYLVSRLAGMPCAELTARQMEFESQLFAK